MASENRDVRLQALQLGNVSVPLSGEGVWARISHGPIGEVVRGNRTSIKTQPGEREGMLTVSCYPEDAASKILRNLANARSGVPGAAAVPLPGAATASGHTSTWSDAHFTAVPDVVLGTTTEVLTFEVALIGLSTQAVVT